MPYAMFRRLSVTFANTLCRAGNRCVRRSIQSLVTANGKELSVTWPDGAQNTYSAVWLRHNCECSECKQPHSGQKVVDAGEVTQNLHISSDGASGDNMGQL